ncbi:hypothetical protein U6A24_16665 [Aquimarina gracilis]|uniref:Uncharacterized protein n=1 Tax=Aquimarina gracilis TaxID=874422 RepID=A0ABU5ZYY4_9FLAO|nr:hypothetical protein [Aquimarina gracilis]MEB3347108.1 hypothetical protein [Aquimarina gracilis]
MKLNKYEFALLNIINEYNNGNGIGTPTLDRLFYNKVEEISDLKNVYDVRWIPLIENLTKLCLVERSPSGKGTIITSKGKSVLLNFRNTPV